MRMQCQPFITAGASICLPLSQLAPTRLYLQLNAKFHHHVSSESGRNRRCPWCDLSITKVCTVVVCMLLPYVDKWPTCQLTGIEKLIVLLTQNWNDPGQVEVWLVSGLCGMQRGTSEIIQLSVSLTMSPSWLRSTN